MYVQRPSTLFKRDLKRAHKRNYDLRKLAVVIEALAQGESLPARYRNHKLVGNYQGYWECHIAPDWLLVYCYEGEYLNLARTGTHADLFD